MKNFIKLLIYIALSILILMFGLEKIFTYSYENPVNPRNKASWLKKMDANEKFDYALFGSSRCLNTVNPVFIDQQTGLSGINMAYNGSNPFEIKLMVHEFLKKYHPKKIYVQVDDRFDRERNDPTSSIFWLPFINEDYIHKQFKNKDSLVWGYKNIPFYRYMLYESKIGFRDVFLSYFKKNQFNKFKGFIPTSGTSEKTKFHYYKLSNQSNIHIKEIETLCKEKEVEVYFFTAPYYKRNLDSDIIEKHVNHYTDFSQAILKREYFANPSHLNGKGAEKFTNIFIKEYFKKE